MTITEVGCMGVKPSLDVINDSTTEGQILTKLYKYVVTAPGGPLRVYWGLEIENPSYLWALFDWNSIQDHENFAKTLGQEAAKESPKILTHGLFTEHITATQSLPVALQSPITEVILAYFPSDISSAQKDAAITNLKNSEKDLLIFPDIGALSYGWGVESDFPVRDGQENQRASILMSFIGLDSIDAHTKFRKTPTFEKLLSLIKNMEKIMKLESLSVSFRSLTRNTEEETIEDM
ncbi:uncharacterized protein N7482_006158 [Penicillium canariense]|uniref:ABM domain-containing protein n=1 Tax=Penicillium canariense TaxID=189055 RepID=A0A9W9I7S5_9EURO|nr:uncharacterized protein N7482_006158 [Penicillium canariense]KAJ5167377.1 hypothetical protein N7482_006158 [Penicillium canariense]